MQQDRTQANPGCERPRLPSLPGVMGLSQILGDTAGPGRRTPRVGGAVTTILLILMAVLLGGKGKLGGN